MTKVRRFAQYLYNTNASNSPVFTYVNFCGACSQQIEGNHRVYTPEMLVAEYDTPSPGESSVHNRMRLGDAEYVRFKLCPYCGAEFDDEWWVRPMLENARVIDHFQKPGWHAGDQHEFRGDGPGCIEHHYLSVSGGSELCWCDPIATPSIDGCTIVHNSDLRYEEVMEARKTAAEIAQRAEIESFERRYAERSGVTVEFLHEHGRFGAVCDYDCDYEDCEGFYMAHAE